jgi:hypothetical protein
MALAVRDAFVTGAVQTNAVFPGSKGSGRHVPMSGAITAARRTWENAKEPGPPIRHPRGRQGVAASTRMEE